MPKTYELCILLSNTVFQLTYSMHICMRILLLFQAPERQTKNTYRDGIALPYQDISYAITHAYVFLLTS